MTMDHFNNKNFAVPFSCFERNKQVKIKMKLFIFFKFLFYVLLVLLKSILFWVLCEERQKRSSTQNMGIASLLPFLKSITNKQAHISEFQGQRVAVDGYW